MIPRPRILLVGPPFSGHLHPLLGIAQELRGPAEVSIATTPGGVTEAARAGLPGHAILAAHEQAVWAISQPGREVKGNPLLLYRQLRAQVGLLADLKSELTALFARERPDLVLADFTVPVAGICAREQGLRWWTSLPSPCVFETPDGPPAYCGGLAPAQSWWGALGHAGLRRATRLFKRTLWLLFRREFHALGFPAIYRADGSEAVYSPERILALSLPELEFPRTYPPHFQFVGPVLYAPPANPGDHPPRSPGRPRVLVTLGTHLPHAKARLAAVMRAVAAARPGIDFHFSHGLAGAVADRAEANFREFDFINYAQHLSTYDAIVHHGGAGVMHHSLRHGRPAVVHPLDFDQFDHAARLQAAGLAVWARRAGELGAAVDQVLHDSALRARCREFQAVHARWDGAREVARRVVEACSR
ncbi:MAG: glycosyl transferase [Verrucomicrobia bacterium]|nr:glycosyl transferase [Verrucomicrobiota bacterium]